MRGIIDDDVKSLRGSASSYLRQELCICLTAFEQLNPLSENEALWQLEIDSNDDTSWEIIAPQFKRAAPVDANLQKFNVLLCQTRQNGVIHLEIIVLYLVGVVACQI